MLLMSNAEVKKKKVDLKINYFSKAIKYFESDEEFFTFISPLLSKKRSV